jgi:transcriptional regulator with XRE-family HTH domain
MCHTTNHAPLNPPSPLQRLKQVRLREGVSQRTIARHLGVSVSEVKMQEEGISEITLSTLYQWQSVLRVPISELLVEPDDALTGPVMQRAQVLRLMKTAQTIVERTRQEPIRRMARNLLDQLSELAPDLPEVVPWPLVGQRRDKGHCGILAEQMISEAAFFRHESCD